MAKSRKGKGYRRKVRTFTLTFEGDEDFEDLEITVRAAPISRVLGLFDLSKFGGGEADLDKVTVEDIKSVASLVDVFARALVSWNVEEPVDPENEDGPWREVPPTLEGVESQDFDWLLKLIMAWVQNTINVGDDLGKDLTSGSSTGHTGESPRTAELSASLQSLTVPN